MSTTRRSSTNAHAQYPEISGSKIIGSSAIAGGIIAVRLPPPLERRVLDLRVRRVARRQITPHWRLTIQEYTVLSNGVWIPKRTA